MGGRTAFVGFLIAGVAALACNALTGIGDLSTSSGPAGDAAPETTVPDTGPPVDTGDGATEAAAPVDAGPPPLCPSAGNSCVPAAPPGWDGPFLVYGGDRSAAPDCPSVMPVSEDENAGAPQGSITCADCRCQAPARETCTFTLQSYANDTCTAPESADLDPTSCLSTDPDGGATSATVTTAVSGGSCAPFAATQQPSAVTWPNVARLCSRSDAFLGDGCPDGSLCVPDGVQPYQPHTCIRQMHADVACPAPWTEKATTFNDVADTRACDVTSCGCKGPTGSTCSGLLRVSTASASCTGAFTNVKVPTTSCVVGGANESARIVFGSTSFSGGSCQPFGTPSATGTVAGGSDVNTICCVP